MTGPIQYLAAHWIEWLTSGLAATLAWIGTNALGKPLVAFWSDRRQVLEAVQEHGQVDYFASQERVSVARAALRAAAAKMAFYAQGGPIAAKAYCWLRCYDPGFAWLGLNGLHDIVGEGRADDQQRTQADAIRVCLGATAHLSAIRKKELKRLILETRNKA